VNLSDLVAQLPWRLYYLLPCCAMGFIAIYWITARPLVRAWAGEDKIAALRGFLLPFLLAAAALSMGNYLNFGNFRHNSFLNAYEFYHYYLGSKYAPEIRYTDLYNASIVAQAELFGAKSVPKTVRNLDTGKRGYSTAEVLKDAEAVKAHFSPERWEAWLADIRWFKSQLTGGRWNGMVADKGYNATPVWSAVVGGIFSNNVDTSNRTGMLMLASLDLVLIALATACVAWAFGIRTAAFFLLLLGTHYVMKFSHMKGAYLRTDFIMSLVFAVCMVRKAHYKTAGAFMAYATFSRVFPVVYLFGLGAKAAWDLWSRRRIDARYLRFFVAYTVASAALVGGSIVYQGNLDLWRDFAGKIGMHNEQVSPWRVGFKYLFIGTFLPPKVLPNDTAARLAEGRNAWENMGQWFKDHKVVTQSKYYAEHKGLWWSIQALMLLVSFFLVRGLSDTRALIYGFVPCFFLASPTYYYYIMLLVPLLFYAPYIERGGHALGLLLMFFTAMAGYYFNEELRFAQEFPTYYWMSVLIFMMVLHMMLLSGWATWRACRAQRNAPPGAPVEDGALLSPGEASAAS
jgi:hypothetical protein